MAMKARYRVVEGEVVAEKRDGTQALNSGLLLHHLRAILITVAATGFVQSCSTATACEGQKAKVGRGDFRAMVAASECIAVARIISINKTGSKEYAVIQPIEQLKGHINDNAHLLTGFGEGKVFTLKPGSVAILCVLKTGKSNKTKNVYRDAYAGRGIMPLLSATGTEVVEVDTQVLTNVPAKKLERHEIGLRWEGWRDYYSFYSYASFLSVMKNLVATSSAKTLVSIAVVPR